MVQTNVAGVTDDNDGQVVAEVVQADLPSPGIFISSLLLLLNSRCQSLNYDYLNRCLFNF